MKKIKERQTSASSDAVAPESYFRQQLAEDKFVIQRCERTGRAVFYPRAISPFGGGALHWERASGRGEIYSVSVVRRRPERGGDYNVVLVDLEEGARLMSTVVDVDSADVHIGMAVQARIEHPEGCDPRLVFVPATQANQIKGESA